MYIYFLSTRSARNRAYFRFMSSGFRDTNHCSKLPHSGTIKNWNLKNIPQVAHIIFSTPRSRNWSYFRSTGSGVRDTGCFFKLPYLAMKPGIWNTQSCICTLFVSQGVEVELIFNLRSAVFAILANFQNFHTWVWHPQLEQKKFETSKGAETELIFALREAFLRQSNFDFN